MQTTKTLTGRVIVKDADLGEVEAVFATLNVVDKDGDVIEPGAIEDGATVVISPYGHKVWDGAPPVGVGTIHEVGDDAVIRAKYFMDTDAGRNDFHTVKGLAEAGKGEWSFGLLNIKSQRATKNGVTANYISSVEVPEVSPVFIGAGVNTRTLSAKSADAPEQPGVPFSEHLTAVLADVKALNDRAAEVVALRAAKGKTISDEASSALADIGAELEHIKALIEQPEPPTPPSDFDADAEFARFVAHTQGVTL